MSDCGCVDTTPCESQDLGCKFEVDASCVRYTNADLTCINTTQGDTLEKVLHRINTKLCYITQGTYLQTSTEPAGYNCSTGGIRVNVRNLNTDAVISTHYLCDNDCSVRGLVSINEVGAFGLSATLTDIPGPVSYQWSFADSIGHFQFTTATDIAAPSIDKNPAAYPYMVVPPVGVFSGDRWDTLIKLVVLDVNGNYHTAYYEYSRTQYLYE